MSTLRFFRNEYEELLQPDPFGAGATHHQTVTK